MVHGGKAQRSGGKGRIARVLLEKIDSHIQKAETEQWDAARHLSQAKKLAGALSSHCKQKGNLALAVKFDNEYDKLNKLSRVTVTPERLEQALVNFNCIVAGKPVRYK